MCKKEMFRKFLVMICASYEGFLEEVFLTNSLCFQSGVADFNQENVNVVDEDM